MSELKAKAQDKPNFSSTLPPTEEEQVPIEVVLAIFYTQAKRLEADGLIQVLAGTHNHRKVTYIRMLNFEVDELLGFRLVPTEPTLEVLAEKEK